MISREKHTADQVTNLTIDCEDTSVIKQNQTLEADKSKEHLDLTEDVPWKPGTTKQLLMKRGDENMYGRVSHANSMH